jgi:ABC-type polysaccharide/polyol phosphate export permease
MAQRVSTMMLILFAVAALILVLLIVGIATGYVTLDIYFRPLPRSVQIISLLVLLCAGLFWLWRIKGSG